MATARHPENFQITRTLLDQTKKGLDIYKQAFMISKE
jgi:hypothetical protein